MYSTWKFWKNYEINFRKTEGIYNKYKESQKLENIKNHPYEY